MPTDPTPEPERQPFGPPCSEEILRKAKIARTFFVEVPEEPYDSEDPDYGF